MGLTALQAQGERLGAAPVSEYRGATTAARFSDPRAEFFALRSSSGIYDLGFRVKLNITGRDRVRWLNGMVTNNIRDLAPGRGVYAFLLNPQGHILGDLYAFNRGESMTADTDRSQLEKILATFRRYIIMDDVEITDLSDELTALGIAGPKAHAVLQAIGLVTPELPPLEIRPARWRDADCTLLRSDNELGPTYEIWLAPSSVRPLWEALLDAGGEPVGSEALELQRIASGMPLYGVDIRERDLPQETEQARALNFSKGCYIGQEIVERIRSRGAVHRKFTGFVVEGVAPISAGAKILAGGKEVGEITSAVSLPYAGAQKTVALGYIRREASTAGEVTIGDRPARVIQPPVADSLLATERPLEHHQA
jgi:folate-binding protein YgfZ